MSDNDMKNTIRSMDMKHRSKMTEQEVEDEVRRALGLIRDCMILNKVNASCGSIICVNMLANALVMEGRSKEEVKQVMDIVMETYEEISKEME
jgi:hypothetical protein